MSTPANEGEKRMRAESPRSRRRRDQGGTSYFIYMPRASRDESREAEVHKKRARNLRLLQLHSLEDESDPQAKRPILEALLQRVLADPEFQATLAAALERAAESLAEEYAQTVHAAATALSDGVSRIVDIGGAASFERISELEKIVEMGPMYDWMALRCDAATSLRESSSGVDEEPHARR